MPPKKKLKAPLPKFGKAPKKKKKGGAAAAAKEKAIRSAVPYVSEKEKYLQKEFAILTEHIHSYTERVRHFQWENEFLDKEAQRLRDTNKVYLSYIMRRNLRCQNAIISLNDQNRWDMAQIRKEKAALAARYAVMEHELREELLRLEARLSLLCKEVEALRPWQELQQEQLARIRELEKELLTLKVHHSEQMHRLKSRYLHLVAEYEMEAQQKIQALAKLAEKEAVRCLILHVKHVKIDNQHLRHNLVELIKRSHGLKAFLAQLQAQRHLLLQEHLYRQELARRRSWLWHPAAARLSLAPGSGGVGGFFRCSPTARGRVLSPRALPSISAPSVAQPHDGGDEDGADAPGGSSRRKLTIAPEPLL
nr:coiled-coil domain-containing protein 166 [Anolis sagrei ordinatus]